MDTRIFMPSRVVDRRVAWMHGPAFNLAARRLSGSFGVRVGAVGALAVGLAFAASAATGDAGPAHVVRAACWVGAGPAALTAARAPGLRDRMDGVDVLVALRGVSARGLQRIRLSVAAFVGGLLVFVPTLLVSMTAMVATPTANLALRGVTLSILAALVGALIGALGAACGEIGRDRGRSLLAAVVVVPWILADLWSTPSLSLIGLVDASVSVVTSWAGVHGWGPWS